MYQNVDLPVLFCLNEGYIYFWDQKKFFGSSGELDLFILKEENSLRKLIGENSVKLAKPQCLSDRVRFVHLYEKIIQESASGLSPVQTHNPYSN